jgi:hypothetical protein
MSCQLNVAKFALPAKHVETPASQRIRSVANPLDVHVIQIPLN